MCSWGLSDIIDSIEVWVVGSKDSTEVLVIDSISHGGKTFREHCVSYHSVFLCVCVWGGGAICICVVTAGQQQVWWWCVQEEGMVMVCDDSWTATRVWWLCVLKGR